MYERRIRADGKPSDKQVFFFVLFLFLCLHLPKKKNPECKYKQTKKHTGTAELTIIHYDTEVNRILRDDTGKKNKKTTFLFFLIQENTFTFQIPPLGAPGKDSKSTGVKKKNGRWEDFLNCPVI